MKCPPNIELWRILLTQEIVALQQNIVAMTNEMHRGGPDDEGILVNETLGYALGHRRLSIIDLTATGHQPMVDEASEIEISFNGEIYNYQ